MAAMVTSAVQTPDVLSTALGGSATMGMHQYGMSAHQHIDGGGSGAGMALAHSNNAVLDEATALMFAAERGAVRSIQAWMARGGDINGTMVQQVRALLLCCDGVSLRAPMAV